MVSGLPSELARASASASAKSSSRLAREWLETKLEMEPGKAKEKRATRRSGDARDPSRASRGVRGALRLPATQCCADSKKPVSGDRLCAGASGGPYDCATPSDTWLAPFHIELDGASSNFEPARSHWLNYKQSAACSNTV